MTASYSFRFEKQYRYLTDCYIMRWENQTLWADLILTIPIGFCLFAGIFLGHPAAGMIAAGGAMNTGFGKKQVIYQSNLFPMILVTLGMALAGFLGVLVGHNGLWIVPLVALSAFGYGMLTTRTDGYAWVAQQSIITLLVASAFPAPLKQAALRGTLLLLGGLLQLLFSTLLSPLLGQMNLRVKELKKNLFEEELALRTTVVAMANSVWQRKALNSALPYAIRVTFALTLATEIARHLHYSSGYWIPMTALVVMKPTVVDTVNRVAARTLGTLAGAACISFLLAHLNPGVIPLAMLTLLFAWLGYGFVNVNYALFTFTVTGYIVFLLSIIKTPELEVAVHRTVCTLIGVSIAASVRLLVITHYRSLWKHALHKLTARSK